MGYGGSVWFQFSFWRTVGPGDAHPHQLLPARKLEYELDAEISGIFPYLESEFVQNVTFVF